jgi:hypothetical protein
MNETEMSTAFEVHLFPKRVSYDFSYFIDMDVYLFQV